jgi:DNA-binding MarR family transcriptional regulator
LTPGQFAILLLVEHNPGLTQQSLSDGIRVEKSTLVVRLHRLEERGLLRRIRSDNDRRSNVLQVTAEGKKCLRTMLAFVRQHEDRVLSGFSASERQQLLKLLGKVMLVGAQQGDRSAVGAKRAESTGRTAARRASNGSAGRARTVAGAKRASSTRRA